MISFDQVTFTYAEAVTPVLRNVNLRIDEGELALVVGRTGVGKSTLLGAINGLVPHFTGGTLAGRVMVDGRETRTNKPRELADVVGVVGQDPLAGFVTDTVEEELAYVMEQLAIPPDVMRKRVEETLDLLGIAELRDRSLVELSGGQQQRVAIGSVLTAQPRVLVLDEPTSALDPTAAEEVLAAITRLVHDLGVTVVLAEHRLERVVQYADRVIEVRADGTVAIGAPAAMLVSTQVAPPVVQLGRLAGWEPLPLSVRDARRMAGPLRERIGMVSVPPPRRAVGPVPGESTVADRVRSGPALRAINVVVRYGPVMAVRGVDFAVAAGEVTALMGRNGSGKSSLLWALQGSGPRQSGLVDVAGCDPQALSPAKARALVALVPQTPADLLYLDTVAEELDQADDESGSVVGAARRLLDRLAPGIAGAMHPRDLSEGQRLALVLAIQLAAAPKVVLLDEPTRGLDYTAKRSLIDIVDLLAAEGHSVVIATHDVEFVAAAADRVVVMAAGDVVADGPTAQVLVASPAFAPQVAKILAPLAYMTIDQVRDALDVTEAGLVPPQQTRSTGDGAGVGDGARR
jgi:energy-coupling factor transporter ATP-binding protein EcfA2